MNFSAHRPPDYTGPEEQYLPKLSRDLTRRLVSAQEELAYDTLRLPRAELRKLALVLVEFAEDLHHDLGLWKSLEQYHRIFFGTPLPLNEPIDPSRLYENRVCHLLWVLYAEINPDLILAPRHQDLRRLARIITDFLPERFAKISPESGLKQFLAQPNSLGWDVKRKLLWLGQDSYLFRYPFHNYVQAYGGQPEIKVIDDFVCQHPTGWAGLGVIDILAAVLDIPEAQRAELRSWYERRMAYYRILAIRRSSLQVMNLINDQPYTIRMENPKQMFKVDQVILGSLTPWRGVWYWSGEQLNYGYLSAKIVQEFKQEFLTKMSHIAYRYCDQLLEQTRESVQTHYERFVSYHGDDLVTYPDGLSMAADMQKEYRLQNETLPPEVVEEMIKRYGLSSAAPKMSFPPQLIESKHGIGVYFNRRRARKLWWNSTTWFEG